MTYSIIKKLGLEGAHRLDAEYYQPEYLNFEQTVKQSGTYKLWRDIEGKFITGPFGSEFNVENYVIVGKYRYVRGKDVKEFFLLDDDNVYIPEKDFERLKKYSLNEGDILVSVVGTLGDTAIVDKSNLPAIFSCKSTAFRTAAINPHYFLAYLNSKYGQGFLERSVRGTVQTGLNINDLKDLPIYIPSLERQHEIGLIVIASKRELENSKSLYSQAENMLLEELGLKNFKADEESWSIVNFSDVEIAGRIDAEYFQPKYGKLMSLIRANKGIALGQIAKRIKKRVKIIPNVNYGYTEISDINAGNGDVSFNLVEGKELPANAKIKIEGGELLISKVRPTRGAITIIPDSWSKNHIASGAFSVFGIVSPMREYLQVVLRSMIGKLQMERPTTGTSYPTITDQDVENLIIPILSKPIQQKIADFVRQSHDARKKAKELLGEAKRKVEEMIEQKK